MNKQELLKVVSEKTDKSAREITPIFNAFLETIQEAVAKGDPVRLTDFGTFSAKDRAARTGVMPGTRNVIEIPAKRVPHFKPGAAFKELVK